MHLTTPTVTTLQAIPAGTPGIMQTLKVMSRLVKEGKKTFAIHNAAAYRTMSCAPKDYACEVRILHAFVRDGIRYVLDTNGAERLQTPDKTLEIGTGDCDDKSILLASLLESIGHPTRFKAIGFTPGIYEHVYVETKIGTQWIPLETTEPVEAGWEPDPAMFAVRPLIHYN